jgi:site-specific recombinase XerD
VPVYNELRTTDYQYWIHSRYSENTAKTYTYELKKFLRYLNKKVSFQKADLETYVNQCVSPRSRNRAIAFLKNFYGFLVHSKECEEVEFPKPVKINKELLKQDYASVKIRLRAMPEKTPLQTRDKLIAYLLFYSKYKVSEICEMRMMDSVRTKNTDTIELVVKHNYTHDQIWPYSSEYRFTSKKASKINRRSIWRIIKKLGIGPQVLRNSNEDMAS